MGPYSGKETGETALLRSLLGSFSAGDLLVADRYYCSFLMIALLCRARSTSARGCTSGEPPIFAAASGWVPTTI